MSHNNAELSRGKWRARVICEENTVRDNMRHSDTQKVHVHSCDEGGAAANADTVWAPYRPGRRRL